MVNWMCPMDELENSQKALKALFLGVSMILEELAD